MRVKHQETGESQTQRLEAFSDGIFAIAITLLVLEISIPRLSHDTPGALRDMVLKLWPEYLTYIFSFITVGIYWTNHHYIFKIYKQTDHVFLLLNVLFLMCIAFVPLPTAVLGEYVLDPLQRHTAVVLYNVALLLPALTWSFSWLYAAHDYRLIDRRLNPAFVKKMTRQYMMSNVLYTVSIVLALWNSIAGLAIAVGLTALYLMPPPEPQYVDD